MPCIFDDHGFAIDDEHPVRRFSRTKSSFVNRHAARYCQPNIWPSPRLLRILHEEPLRPEPALRHLSSSDRTIARDPIRRDCRPHLTCPTSRASHGMHARTINALQFRQGTEAGPLLSRPRVLPRSLVPQSDNDSGDVGQDARQVCSVALHSGPEIVGVRSGGQPEVSPAPYAFAYRSSEHRKAHLPHWTHVVQLASPAWQPEFRNAHQSPRLNRDNLLRLHIYLTSLRKISS